MILKLFKPLMVIVVFASSIYAQSVDGLIYAEGKILDAKSKEPINARITYQSVPFGNRVGSLKGTVFSFAMFDNEKYSITVEASGFETAKYVLDPTDANAEKKVIRNVELNAVVLDTAKHAAGQLMRLNNLIFQVGKAKVSPESFHEIDIIVNMMKQNKSMIIRLEGHTDYQGNAKDNMRLSQERVDAVKEYLVSKKIEKARIKTKAFGGTIPLSRDNTPEAHRLNRRVELRILEN